MSSPFHPSRYSNELTGAGYIRDERDDKGDGTLAAEIVGAGLDSDETSDINPGGLTFEEGLSLQLCLQGNFSDM
jgi:hypothetical protein